jgi:hypothetical protein
MKTGAGLKARALGTDKSNRGSPILRKSPGKMGGCPCLSSRIIRSFKAMAPVIEFLNQIFLESGAGEEEGSRPKRPVPMF